MTDLATLVAQAKDTSLSEEARTQAVHALARFPAEEAVPVLIELMHDNALSVRWTAASTLRKFGRAMLPHLLRAIATQPADAKFYESAHHALVRFGDPAVEALLEPVLEELKQTPAASKAAVEAMKALEALEGTS
jgi:HEAT repeat protein